MSESKPKKSCCPACSSSRAGLWWLVLIAAAVITVAVWPTREDRRQSFPADSSSVTGAATPAAEAKVDLQFLTGRWIRPDGGYVIEIRQVDADGQLDANYFNPRPIRVVGARAAKEGAAIKVYLELNDVNYPGCKYNLTYLPEQRQLVGTYFQAAMQQTYEVAFERE